MVILDAAIVTVALPSIETDLGFSAQGLQWVMSAYALTFAGVALALLGRSQTGPDEDLKPVPATGSGA